MSSPGASQWWFRAIVVLALLYTALLSWWSPLTSDSYHHALTGMEHRFSLAAVWDRSIISYMTWNPRIGEYIAFAVATAGKWLFCLVNPFVQVALGLMMFYLIEGRKVNPSSWKDLQLFSLGLLILFTCTARPGVTIFWLSGATNYSWAAAVWLGFLCMYRCLASGEPVRQAGGWKWTGVLVLGFLSGMTNENNIPATWLLLGVLFAVFLLKKKKLPLWYYAGVLSHIVGSLCMLLAPGVSARMNSATPGCAEPLSGIMDRVAALPELLLKMHEYLPLTFLLGGVAAWSLWRAPGKTPSIRRQLGLSVAYIFTAYAMTLSFCAAVIPADHAMFSATLLFGTGVMGLVKVWYDHPAARPRPRMFIAVFGALCGVCLLSTVHDHYLMFLQQKERELLIGEQKTSGMMDVSVPAFVRPSAWCAYIFWVDLSSSPDDYVNRGAATYYGVQSIRTQ